MAGVDPARPVRADGDSAAAQLGGEVDGVVLQRGFRGGIGIAADHAIRAGNDRAGDVDDAAPAGGRHAGQRRSGESHGREDVDLGAAAQLRGRDGKARGRQPGGGT